jgi:predicted hydrocarbon binding protein
MVAAPEGEISPTYCHCSKGFVKKLWKTVLEKPVEVELIQSAIPGANECKFVIHI